MSPAPFAGSEWPEFQCHGSLVRYLERLMEGVAPPVNPLAGVPLPEGLRTAREAMAQHRPCPVTAPVGKE